ncbi:hypothetical protein CEXT_466401 [Caerostris extrusa]|uniref:Uncharacterized protein n=1 Tax=Caerostris extrusa TaxID=172846 RepID=A0AAV4T743_CAEEX|nr:hypothetical protein CEXT_466401 [Caerostris extrusa]
MPFNTIHQIMAIEAKLKAMEEQREKEFEMCLSSTRAAADNPFLINKTATQSQHKKRNAPYKRHGNSHRR